MRGLENFITVMWSLEAAMQALMRFARQDIRACTTKEEEAKRVHYELTKIREKFSETTEMSGQCFA
jgi:hypothetical protein